MDLIRSYSDDDQNDQNHEQSPKVQNNIKINPDVVYVDPSPSKQLVSYDKQMYSNMKYDDLSAPILGPVNPQNQHYMNNAVQNKDSENIIGGRISTNTVTGYVESYHMNPVIFNDQYGKTHNNNELRKKMKKNYRKGDDQFVEMDEDDESSSTKRQNSSYYIMNTSFRKKGDNNKTEDDVLKGFPKEAYIVSEEQDDNESEKNKEENNQEDPSSKKRKIEETNKNDISKKQKIEPTEETAIININAFTNKRLYDYQNRTFTHIPSEVKNDRSKMEAAVRNLREQMKNLSVINSSASKQAVVYEFNSKSNNAALSEESQKFLTDIVKKRFSSTQLSKQKREFEKGTTEDANPEEKKNIKRREILKYCYIPKKCVHTFKIKDGTEKKKKNKNKRQNQNTKNIKISDKNGVSRFELFPKYGHLMLSGNLNSKIYMHDIEQVDNIEKRYSQIITYTGHSKAVRDISFYEKDGKKFVSCSYDRTVKIWDTETGKILRSISHEGKIPLCVKFYPNNENNVLVGYAEKKVLEFDLRQKDDDSMVVQEYSRHLDAINTITFFDEGRRFVTSSDDKTLRIWEYGIPVDIKYIADPLMHSMPSVKLSPNGKYFITQSMDNQILVYETDKMRQNNKKRFVGHTISGYACQLDFSNDGNYVISGDADGNLNIWDWNSCKLLNTFNCHNNVLIDCKWHPYHTSRIVTASWDGSLKYWD